MLSGERPMGLTDNLIVLPSTDRSKGKDMKGIRVGGMGQRMVAGTGAALMLLDLAACSKKDDASVDASTLGATSAMATTVDAGAPAPVPPPARTPKELLEDHRRSLATLAAEAKYAEVCKGAPWFNQTICNWVAARASGKAVERPDGELLRGYFAKEHWKHVNGTIVGDPQEAGDYLEVSVGGYRNHCVLTTVDTKFRTRGRFEMWVQEQPNTHEVTLNSGATANWVVLEEAPLAKNLMAIAKSSVDIESTAMAKDAMKMIAEYQTYAELKGEIPPVPGASPSVTDARAPAAAPAPAMSASSATAQAMPVVAKSVAAAPARVSKLTPAMKACCDAVAALGAEHGGRIRIAADLCVMNAEEGRPEATKPMLQRQLSCGGNFEKNCTPIPIPAACN